MSPFLPLTDSLERKKERDPRRRSGGTRKRCPTGLNYMHILCFKTEIVYMNISLLDGKLVEVGFTPLTKSISKGWMQHPAIQHGNGMSVEDTRAGGGSI